MGDEVEAHVGVGYTTFGVDSRKEAVAGTPAESLMHGFALRHLAPKQHRIIELSSTSAAHLRTYSLSKKADKDVEGVLDMMGDSDLALESALGAHIDEDERGGACDDLTPLGTHPPLPGAPLPPANAPLPPPSVRPYLSALKRTSSPPDDTPHYDFSESLSSLHAMELHVDASVPPYGAHLPPANAWGHTYAST